MMRKRGVSSRNVLFFCSQLMLSQLLCLPQAGASDILPRPEEPFKGHMGRTVKDSVPDFPKPVTAPKGAPNILIIMTDDVGFGASSTFGGPVPTPTFDRLAENGLRYTQFHTTALSSPTRAALLTGRNHHTAATGVIMEMGTGYPGYNTVMSKSVGTFAEVLKQNGYGTSWYGKNHNVPDWHTSQAGPFDLWPTNLGFEYFYGFLGGDTNQWRPALFEGTKPVEPPYNDKSYILDKDLADHAIAWIKAQHSIAPDKPFLVYYMTGTSHAPHHAPPEWIAKFKGRFDQGWDKVREETFRRQQAMGIVPKSAKLTPRPDEIPAWDTLNADQKKLYARMMEVYAAALSHADYQIGRIVQTIADLGKLDNTLVIYIQGDNGASAEGRLNGLYNELTVLNGLTEDYRATLQHMDKLGSPATYNHYPAGWAHAMDTPFQWTKQVASHFGGTRNGLVISWPKKIKDKGGIRSQFHHVIDIAPTVFEATGVQMPAILNGVAQKPIEGVSMMYSFNNAKAPSTHRTQYFEMFGNRAIYNDGWIASTTPLVLPWGNKPRDPKRVTLDDANWELYNLAEDFTQAVDLAAKEPKKLREMQDLFWAEAARYNVLPLDSDRVSRLDVHIRPSLTAGRNSFTYYPGMIRLPEGAAPDFKNKSFRITAYVDIPAEGAEGVLLTQGGQFGGLGLYVLNSKPVFVYNFVGLAGYRIAAKEELKPGKHIITFEFTYDGGGIGKGGAGVLSVDGRKVGEGRIVHTVPLRISLDEGFDVGQDTGTAVSKDYAGRMPFKFTGGLEKVTVDLMPVPLSSADQKKIRKASVDVSAR
ncbi:MAG: arylsulfatase [Syntrophobacterales bacterium]|nr:arylsulfatase [Syntrophobacterales bacterium]